LNNSVERTNGCSIKGNINSKGDRIYRVPGSRSYGATKINESKGERWFCSENCDILVPSDTIDRMTPALRRGCLIWRMSVIGRKQLLKVLPLNDRY